ncbi:hypothetical protein bcgnr5412_55360 [Bacillus cereus]
MRKRRIDDSPLSLFLLTFFKIALNGIWNEIEVIYMWSIDLAVYLLGMTGIICVLSIWVGLVLEKRKTTIEGK